MGEMSVGQSAEAEMAYTTAQSALEQMAERNIPPTPENYSLWFTRLNGNSPCRWPTRDARPGRRPLMRPGASVADDPDAGLYDGEGQEPALSEISAKVEAAIATLLAGIGSAGQDARHYGTALGSLAGELSGGVGLAVLQKAVAGVLVETHRMLEKTKTLQRRLTESSNEVKTLRERIEAVRREAMTDALTGIANRKALNKNLREATRESTTQSSELCLLMVDIDHFKRFNDTYGHTLGDQVLKLVAKTLVDNIKGRDFAARYGGEEFCILLPDTRLPDAMTLADQLRLAVSRKRIVKKGTGEDFGGITLSVGAARFVAGEPVIQLIRRADAALYLAKRQGRDRVASEEELPPEPPSRTPLG